MDTVLLQNGTVKSIITDRSSVVVRLWFSLLRVIVNHYANTPIKYTSIFHGCKNDNFHMKNSDSFLIFAQNIDRGYTLEPPH